MKRKQKPLTDLEFMQSPDRWPRWPYLPVKRIINGVKEHGLLISDRKAVVYEANLYRLPEDLRKVPHKDYTSFSALTQDGWVVD